MTSSPMLSVKSSGGVFGCDHFTLQRRFIDLPEEKRKIRSISLPGKYTLCACECVVRIWMPISDMFSINTPYFSLPEMRSAFKLTLNRLKRRFSMTIL